MSKLTENEASAGPSSSVVDDTSKVDSKLMKLAVASPILAAAGFVVAASPLLALLQIFAGSTILYLLVSVAPILVLALEVLALVFGIRAVRKLPKETSARGVAASGVYIACVLFFAAIAIAAYFLVNAIVAGVL